MTARLAHHTEPDWSAAFAVAKNTARRYHVPCQELDDIASEAVVRFLTYDAPRYDLKRSGAGGYMATRLQWRIRDVIIDWRCQNLDLTATEKKAVHLWNGDCDHTANLDILTRYFRTKKKLSAVTAYRHATHIVTALATEPTEILVDPATMDRMVQEDTGD